MCEGPGAVLYSMHSVYSGLPFSLFVKNCFLKTFNIYAVTHVIVNPRFKRLRCIRADRSSKMLFFFLVLVMAYTPGPFIWM